MDWYKHGLFDKTYLSEIEKKETKQIDLSKNEEPIN